MTGPKSISKRAVVTDQAPQAIGPYSQGMRCGDWLFLSGQIALDPETGHVVGDTIEAQAKQVFENILGILKSEEMVCENIVKTTVYLKNMSQFLRFNEVYARFVKPPFPARSTVEVARLPKDVLVEIEAIAYGGNKH